MLISRGATILRTANLLKNRPKSNQSVRNGGHAPWNYRIGSPEAPKWQIYVAEGVQGFMWWWMLWHLWTQFDHITGEFHYPDPSKWTDEELGIPPPE